MRAGRGLAALALLFGGCATVKMATAPLPPPQNYFAPADRAAPIRRVALLPLFNAAYPERYVRGLDAAFLAELEKKARFEVVAVGRAQMESLFGERQFGSADVLPAEVLTRLRAHFGVDGVIFTDLTSFSPYRPVSMGVRAKLADAATGRIRWAFDYLFDAGHAPVAEAAKRFQLQYSSPHLPLTTDGGSVLLSPARFAKYVASETFASLRQE